jgi:PhoPQ-activated pathogenicity-related protein
MRRSLAASLAHPLIAAALFSAVLAASCLSCARAQAPAPPIPTNPASPGPIFDYVAAPDPSFRYEVTQSPTNGIAGQWRIEMDSQTWQGILWHHRIAVIIPDQLTHPETAFLFITGGNPDRQLMAIGSVLASSLGLPVAVLGDIPNQPLFGNLHEDGLIAYTFSKFLETHDPTWPALFPMTKSAVRAMDALQAISAQRWGRKIESFIVAGASKRGWTTWFTSVVDPRVRAALPMVYNNLNLPAQMKHQIQQWGAYSEQIDDYTRRGLPDLVSSEAGKQLAAMVDPYTYRDRATMPKLIIAGANDPYWPVDAASDYFADLKGPSYLLHLPNSGHGMNDQTRLLKGVVGFMAGVLGEYPLPTLQWTIDRTPAGATLKLSSNPAPQEVLAWVAHSDTTDFRKSRWESSPATATDGQWSFTVPTPDKDHVAFYLEADYRLGTRELPLTTEVYLVNPPAAAP